MTCVWFIFNKLRVDDADVANKIILYAQWYSINRGSAIGAAYSTSYNYFTLTYSAHNFYILRVQ